MKIFLYIFFSVIVILVGTFLFMINVSNKTTEEYLTSENIQGELEIINCNRIKGWAWLPYTPDLSVYIKVIVDTEEKYTTSIVSTVADQERPDIAALLTGDKGKHGFEMEVPDSLKDNINHSVYVYAFNPSDKTSIKMLNKTPVSLLCQK